MSGGKIPVLCAIFCCALACAPAQSIDAAQTPPPARGLPPPASASLVETPPSPSPFINPASELRTGADLTRRGLLEEAIPHLLAAREAGADAYATGVNLGICYLGTGSYKKAIAELESLRGSGHKTSAVENLLAEAYLGDGQTGPAFQVFQQAAAAAPKDEKLYAYMADACTDHQDYDLGLRITDIGLRQLPGSARLHYERAVFLGRLDRFDEAKPEFDLAWKLAPESDIGYLALVQKDLYETDLPAATKLLRQAVQSGHRDYQMLSLLGSVLLYEGAVPGQPRFAEARAALEESAKDRPGFSATQIALGKLYLREGRYRDAAAHLEEGRRLEPSNAAVYASLARAYNALGDRQKARNMEQQLGRLLKEKKQLRPEPNR